MILPSLRGSEPRFCYTALRYPGFTRRARRARRARRKRFAGARGFQRGRYDKPDMSGPGLKQFLFNLSQILRAVGAWRLVRRTLGLRSPRSLRPRLACDGPLALGGYGPGLKQFLFNLSQILRAVGAWRLVRKNLGLRSPCSLRPRLACDGPLALQNSATNYPGRDGDPQRGFPAVGHSEFC
jgi:hypothetical protein